MPYSRLSCTLKGVLSERVALKTHSMFGRNMARHWHHGRKQVQRSSLEGIVLSGVQLKFTGVN